MLLELDVAIRDALSQFLVLSDPIYTSNRIINSIIDDKDTHFRMYEKVPTNTEVRFPFCVVYRGALASENQKHFSSSASVVEDVVLSQNSSNARTVRGKNIELEYRIIIYDDDTARISQMLVYWILNSGSEFTKFNFFPSFLEGESVPVSIAIDFPEETRPTHNELEESGLVFRTDFPMSVRTFLVSNVVDFGLILQSNLSIVEENTSPEISLAERTYTPP